VVTGLLPVIGVPLPFVSYGGSALTFTLSAVGVLLSFARPARAPGSGGRGGLAGFLRRTGRHPGTTRA
jgi:cell division protein FtsW